VFPRVLALSALGAVLFAASAGPEAKSPEIAATAGNALQECLRDATPATILESRQLAEKTIGACSAALQSRTPAEVAQARLYRSAARTALPCSPRATISRRCESPHRAP
jgi:hypothetical protein